MKIRVAIAGGGTGGHIYPGVAIARALEKLNPNIEVHFIGSALGLETRIIPREGYPLHLLPAGKLNYGGSLLAKLKTLFKLPLAFIRSAFWLFKYRPQFVLGVGGYASGPFVFTASLFGFQAAIWEPNAHPGLTNRWLSRWVKKSYLVFEEAKKDLKSKMLMKLGLPVRPELEQLKINPREDEDFHILIFGGSQGARFINRVVLDSVKSESPWLHKARLIHQTGVTDFSEIQSTYKKSIFPVQAYEFLHEMNHYYDWADLVICRSGASTLAELAAVGKPAILVPLPTSADDHQKKNAQAVAASGGAILLEQNQLNVKSLNEVILKMQKSPEILREMAVKMRSFHSPNAADAIAKDIQSIISKKGVLS